MDYIVYDLKLHYYQLVAEQILSYLIRKQFKEWLNFIYFFIQY